MLTLDNPELRQWRVRRSFATVAHVASLASALSALFLLPWYGGESLVRLVIGEDGFSVVGNARLLIPASVITLMLVAMAALPSLPALGLWHGTWLGNDSLYAVSIAFFGVAFAGFWYLWDAVRAAQNPSTFGIFVLIMLAVALSGDWTFSRVSWGWGGQAANLVLYFGSGFLATFLWYAVYIIFGIMFRH